MHHGRRSFVFALLLIACLALFASAGRAQEPPIVFSEILVGNAATTLDNDYTNFSGWIELRNNTGSNINLSKYTIASLRDGATTPDTFTIKTKLNLPAGGRLILWADGLPPALQT